MINWFIDNNVGVSVGMISNNFNGADPIMYDVLKRCVAQGMEKCAIWNHGMDAAFRYGEATTLAEVQARVEGCDTKIKQFFPGYKPFLMAPHQNSWGPFLIQALKNLDYKIVSAAEAAYSGMQWNLTMNPMQMPQQATTGDFSATINDFVGVPVSKTVADCEAAAARGEVCVIMTHPHEFANGAYNLTTLARLVQTLQGHGFTSTNFYTVMNEQLRLTSPPSVTPTVGPTQAPTQTASPSTIAPTVTPTVAPTIAPFTITVSTNGRCGVDFQHTSCGNEQFPCCSQFGWCGSNATIHCGTGCQSPYGLCGDETYAPRASPTAVPSIVPTLSPTSVSTVTPTLAPFTITVSTNGRCGVDFQHTSCGNEQFPCCSQFGWCGSNATIHCGTGCQSPYGLCGHETYAPRASPTAAPSIAPTLSPTSVSTVAPTIAPFTITVSTNGRCGVDFQHTSCGNAQFPCCSQFGWCGSNVTVHCGTGCQSPYGLCGDETYAPRALPTMAPSTAPTATPSKVPTVVPSATPTKQPVSSVPTASPTQYKLQYTAIIHVESSATNGYQWFNVLATVRNIEKDQNLIDLQYSGITEVLSSSSEFDVSIKMTFGLNSDSSSNIQSKYDTTATLLTRAISQNYFDNYYHAVGNDKITTFTTVTFQGDASFVHQINDNSADDSNSKHGLFSFPKSPANISILAAICVSIVLVFLVVGYLVYRRWYLNSDSGRKRASTLTSYGSNEEMLSPSERFVTLELNNHYVVPKSDKNRFVEDAFVHRHGLNLPRGLENV
jgi:hypothetical protein